MPNHATLNLTTANLIDLAIRVGHEAFDFFLLHQVEEIGVPLRQALDTGNCLPLVDERSASLQPNSGALVGLVRLKTHDDYIYMHSVAVCPLMVALALKMGQDEAQVREAGLAGMLHDMGKARIAHEVLNKPGRLTDEEYVLVKRHPLMGRNLLEEAGISCAVALDVCLHHHERPDGKGYPDALSGDVLSLPARMGAVCDVYRNYLQKAVQGRMGPR